MGEYKTKPRDLGSWYIEESETEIDKSKIKTLFGSLYTKACEVE